MGVVMYMFKLLGIHDRGRLPVGDVSSIRGTNIRYSPENVDTHVFLKKQEV